MKVDRVSFTLHDGSEYSYDNITVQILKSGIFVTVEPGETMSYTQQQLKELKIFYKDGD